jgi:hypothetical protein
MHCGFCHGFACEVGAKASTLTTVIPEAEATGRCEVRPESYVFRIETNPQGRATGVAYFDRDRRERFQRARAVVVCANGAERRGCSQMSASARFPDGLANSTESALIASWHRFCTARIQLCDEPMRPASRVEEAGNDSKAQIGRIPALFAED